MNKEEIKSLISAKIAGQGNQVDSGGALDEILNAIVDVIPESGEGARIHVVEELPTGQIADGELCMTIQPDMARIYVRIGKVWKEAVMLPL